MLTDESDTERYQRLARERLALLPTVSRLEGRAALIQMTQVWQRLAEETKELGRAQLASLLKPETGVIR
jgi:hypothetical protein